MITNPALRDGAAMSLAAALTISLFAATESSAPSPTVWDGVFSEAQVGRGRKVYDSLCARCHGETLGGGEDSPALVDQDFLATWYGRTVGELVEYTRDEMPTDGPANYTLKQCTDVTAYVLAANDFPVGRRELQPNLKALNQILITPKK